MDESFEVDGIVCKIVRISGTASRVEGRCSHDRLVSLQAPMDMPMEEIRRCAELEAPVLVRRWREARERRLAEARKTMQACGIDESRIRTIFMQRRRTVELRVLMDGSIAAIAPEGCDQAEILDTVARNAARLDWDSKRARNKYDTMLVWLEELAAAGKEERIEVERVKGRLDIRLHVFSDHVLVQAPDFFSREMIRIHVAGKAEWIESQRPPRPKFRSLEARNGGILSYPSAEITVKTDNRCKVPAIHVRPDGSLVVLAPKDMSDDELRGLIKNDAA
ncbi:MAG: hypothetical protein Q4F72_03600, partial [Desulfovibrionaceae bacterium]|nr:hypothetical protein [Desulfovibrionaceae bacterium]